jgi:hypothetical protein
VAWDVDAGFVAGPHYCADLRPARTGLATRSHGARATRVIKSTRDGVVDGPDKARREAWAGLY